MDREEHGSLIDNAGAVVDASKPPAIRVYTREGFSGDAFATQPVGYLPDYISAVGPHAPRRWILPGISPSDQNEATALPMLLADSNRGVRLRLSGRTKRSDLVIRNVEADELHFIQEGEVKFETDAGNLTATRGDFIYLPRATAYRFHALSGAMCDLILETRSPLKFVTPYQVGVVNFQRDLHRAVLEPATDNGVTELLLRAWDGDDTLFTLPNNPLAIERHMGGNVPVWKLNIAKVQKLTSLPDGGPPYPFMSTEDGEVLIFNAGDRPTSGYRPPIHINADFDELMLYVRGESPWGACDQPGTLSWVPKGVVHHGVASSTPNPHTSWMIETKATLRWTDQATAASELMETGTYGPLVKTGKRDAG